MRLKVVRESPAAPAAIGPLRQRHSNDYYETSSAAYAERTSIAGAPPLLDAFVGSMPAGGQAIDLGCGAGRDLASLRRAGLSCVGYDLSPSLAAAARERSGAPTIVADIRELVLPPQSLDGVLASASLLHLEPGDVAGALTRIAGWLRPGGVLLATMKEGAGCVVDRHGRRYTLVTRPRWRAMLRRAGFSEVRTVHSPADAAVSSSDHHWISTLARRP